LWNRFAFVHFKNANACRKAHEKGDGLKVCGKTIMVVYARKKGEAKQTPQDEGQFDEQLLLLFSKSVLFLVMLRYITTDKGRGKCFCPCSFVCLSVC